MSGGHAVVTGSRGFIGAHLVNRLGEDGWDVSPWKGDVRGIGDHSEPADVVFHLAAAARRDRFTVAETEAIDVNVLGTLAVLNFCYKTGAKCVLASTSAVYAPRAEDVPISEGSLIGPSDAYGQSKWLAERVCAAQANDFGVQSIVLRIFNAYGPGQHPGFLVPAIVESLSGGATVPIRMPNAVRDFVYVADVVDALVRASAYGDLDFTVLNIGTGEGTRVRDLLTMAEDVWQSKAEIEPGERNMGEVEHAVADIGEARRVLGWSPLYGLKTGLVVVKESMTAVSGAIRG